MPDSGSQLVEQSLEMAKRAASDERQAFYDRMDDHYNLDLTGQIYFPQYYMETAARYEKRPKRALPLGSSAVDVLAGAMIGDGVQVTIGDAEKHKAENEAWQEIAAANDLGGEFAMGLATQAGLFGWTAERVIPGAEIEFERVDPRHWEPIYNGSAMGRSKRRLSGINFVSVYDADSGQILPRDTSIGQGSKFKRVEVISPTEWWVFLDGKPAPVDPAGAVDSDGDPIRWMPTDDGANPYGVIPVSILWNVPKPSAFEGRSDLDPGYHLAEEINRVYSQMLYNLQMFFPTLTIPKDGQGAAGLDAGVGMSLEYPVEGQAPSWIVTPLDVEVFLKPLRNLLTLFFSSVHTPASAHGLGSVFGEAKSAESGRAKFYEFNRLQQHVLRKRASYERFCAERWRNLAAVLRAPKPFGQAKKLAADAPVSVEWMSEIVPVSADETLDTMLKKMEKGLLSQVEGILADRGWPDDDAHRELAQNVINDIGAAATATRPRTALDEALAEELV